MKMFAGLILALFSVCSAELEPRCAWGQSYWCSALDAAKSCGAIQHCTTTVWKNQLPKQDGGDSCVFCKSIIEDIKRYTEQGKTEEQISQFLSSACGIIPDSSASAKCKKIAEEMIKDLLQLITSEVEPQMICSLLGVCTGLEDNVIHSPVVKPSTDETARDMPLTSVERKVVPMITVNEAEPICDVCKKFFNDIQEMIRSNKTETEFERIINQVICSQLGSFKNECNSLVHTFLPEILQMMATFYEPDLICQTLGCCAAKSSEVKYQLLFTRLHKLPLYKASAEQNSATACLTCKAIMTELQVLDRDKAVQNEIKDIIKTQFCAHIGSLKEVCETTLEQYSAELFELLANVLDPSTRCRSLGFCDTVSSAAVSEEIVPALPLLPLKPALGGATTLEKSDPSTECILCEYAVREIKQMIATNATEEQIIEELEMACKYMPEQYTKQCKDFVDKYCRMVIELLIKEVDPEKVCIQLGLCTGTAQSVAARKISAPLRPMQGSAAKTTGADPTPMCMVCQMMVTELKQMIGDNKTEEEIIQALEKVCSYLPEKYRKQCKDIVDEYADIMIKLLISELDPEQICAQLGLCANTAQSLTPGKALPPIRVSYPRVGSSEACAVCETIIQYLEALLEQGSTMEQIEALMGKLCGYLPEKVVHQCENLVKLYGDLIIHYVSTMASPKEVCKLMSVCDDKVSADISGINRVPRAERSLPQIELEERQMLKPEFEQKVQRLGDNECSWNPQSICEFRRDLVQKCNLEEYCKKNVWAKENEQP